MIADHFYHGSIKKYITIFGSLFNNIRVKRYDSAGTEIKTIKVNLEHTNKERWLSRYDEHNEKNPKTNHSLPRMGFSLSGIEYATDKQFNSRQEYHCPTTPSGTTKVFNPVPFNFRFDLNLYSQYYSDALQIIEQIVPYFSPSLNIPINELPNMGIKNDIPITLESIDPEPEIYSSLSEGDRVLIFNFSFRLEGWVFPATSQIDLIQNVILNFDGDFIHEGDSFTETP